MSSQSKGDIISTLQGCCIDCSSPRVAFGLVKKHIPKFVEALTGDAKTQDQALKVFDCICEYGDILATIPAAGTPGRKTASLEQAGVYFKVGRAAHLPLTIITRAKSFVEAVGDFRSLPVKYSESAETGVAQGLRHEDQIYSSQTELSLACFEKMFKVCSGFFGIGAFAVCQPLQIVELMDKTLPHLRPPGTDPFNWPEPFHSIGRGFDTLMMLDAFCSGGEKLFGMIREGIHYYKYDHGNLGATYCKNRKFEFEGREYFRKDADRIDNSEEIFIEFMERFTKLLLKFLEACSKFSYYLIKAASIQAPIFVKVSLNALIILFGGIVLVWDMK